MSELVPTTKREKRLVAKGASKARRAEKRREEAQRLPASLMRMTGAAAGQAFAQGSKIGDVPTGIAAELGVTVLGFVGVGVPRVVSDVVQGWAIGDLAVWAGAKYGKNMLPF